MITQEDSNVGSIKMEMDECLACMTTEADTTWMPCGHCSMCLECSRNLLSNNSKCPLCKKEPTHILKLKKEKKKR